MINNLINQDTYTANFVYSNNYNGTSHDDTTYDVNNIDPVNYEDDEANETNEPEETSTLPSSGGVAFASIAALWLIIAAIFRFKTGIIKK